MKELSPCSLGLFFVTIVILVGVSSVDAQCRFRACNREGERFNSETGDCESRAGFPTFAISHRVPSCRSGEHFDRATGNCVLDACDEGCEVRELCRGGERYSRSGRDREGVYGVCESGPNFLGHRSHRLVRCAEGFTLNETRGVCVRCRTAPPPRVPPDLTIRRLFLRSTPAGPVVSSVRVGQLYYACFEVANIGAGASGPFLVSGGGLGVRGTPTVPQANLAPGASREGCLLYRTTPSAGTYRLGITADPVNGVRETREDNNTATLEVDVVR
ncbi:MAG TPA: CARDB domain-containing protein [Pyrinomonadaceae bacterium]|jgi:hypothetical protein|nr:CARDB domain-containing protein [Pyrinomonadaceae bacterium]